MTHTQSKNTKYNKDTVKKLIEEKRGGLLVEQLFEAIPENERPARSYFLEFLRSIKGVSISPYDKFKNRFFVSTLHGKDEAKRRLLVMLAAWEYENKRPATWYVEPSGLPGVYKELIARLGNREGKYIKGVNMNLYASFVWSSKFAADLKTALKKRNSPKRETVLTLDDGMVIDCSDVETLNVIEPGDTVFIGEGSK